MSITGKRVHHAQNKKPKTRKIKDGVVRLDFWWYVGEKLSGSKGCDYFTELVRYIHLNPLRAELGKSLCQLDRYRWSGHGVLMGQIKNELKLRSGINCRSKSIMRELMNLWPRYVKAKKYPLKN